MSLSTTPEPGTSTDDENDNMGRHNHPRSVNSRRIELDLSSILNLDQKNQVQLLINSVLDLMQQQIRDGFDNLSLAHPGALDIISPPKPTWNLIPNPLSHKYRHLYGYHPEVGASSENEIPNDNPEPAGPGPASAKALSPLSPNIPFKVPCSVEEASAMSGKTDEEILRDSLSELKRDALTSFGKWRANVQKRLCDTVIKNGGTVGMPARRTPPHTSQAKSLTRKFGPTGGTSLDPSATMTEQIYLSCPTPLKAATKEKRAIVLHTVCLILLGMDNYCSYSRLLLLHMCTSLDIPMNVLIKDEVRVASAVSEIVTGISLEEIAQKRAEEGKTTRRVKSNSVTAATIGPNSVGPVTLAPSLIEWGVGTVFGGYGFGTPATAAILGPLAESPVGVGVLFGLCGARAGGKTMDAFTKEVTDFGWIPLQVPLNAGISDPKDMPVESRRLRVSLGISGWLLDDSFDRNPGKFLGVYSEIYALSWETESLTKMGAALETVSKSKAWKLAKKEIRSRSVFASLKHSLWPAELLKISKVIDNPWIVGMVRAEKVGQILADSLINKIQGERAVSLMGYSLGARVIYACLMSLAEKRAFGLVENVIMIGAPCPTEIRTWAAMKSVVAGRLVNVFSSSDYLLGFLYRNGTWQYGCAGLQKIFGVPGVENLDVSSIISNHSFYQHFVGSILKQTGWEDLVQDRIREDEDKLIQLIYEEQQLDTDRGKAAGADDARETRKSTTGGKRRALPKSLRPVVPSHRRKESNEREVQSLGKTMGSIKLQGC